MENNYRELSYQDYALVFLKIVNCLFFDFSIYIYFY